MDLTNATISMSTIDAETLAFVHGSSDLHNVRRTGFVGAATACCSFLVIGVVAERPNQQLDGAEPSLIVERIHVWQILRALCQFVP
jgi:hypothetical protein